MNEDEIVERVARAICYSFAICEPDEKGDTYPCPCCNHSDGCNTVSRAAIAAHKAALAEAGFVIVPREPTNKEIDAVDKSLSDIYPEDLGVTAMWRAVIGAATKAQ